MSPEQHASGSSPAPPLVVGALVYYFFLRPQMRKWGTRLGESQRRLPGDEIVPRPNFRMTHAIDIDAPPPAVWPWIAQMGRERTGYYSLDILSNQGIPSVSFVRQDIPAPQPGMNLDGGFEIFEVEADRKLLFGGFKLPRMAGVVSDVSALYMLERRRDGSTRLLIRRREFSYGAPGAIYNLIYEIVYFAFAVQQREQLKRYAESMTHLTASPATLSHDGRITL